MVFGVEASDMVYSGLHLGKDLEFIILFMARLAYYIGKRLRILIFDQIGNGQTQEHFKLFRSKLTKTWPPVTNLVIMRSSGLRGRFAEYLDGGPPT